MENEDKVIAKMLTHLSCCGLMPILRLKIHEEDGASFFDSALAGLLHLVLENTLRFFHSVYNFLNELPLSIADVL